MLSRILTSRTPTDVSVLRHPTSRPMHSNQPDSKPVVIGLIYSTNCIHCRNLMPIWDKMETNIKRKSYQPTPEYAKYEHSNLMELDDYNNKNSKYLNNKRIQPDGYPTIFKIKDGIIDYYKDSREPDLLERWFMGDKYLSSITVKSHDGKTKRKRRRKRMSKTARRRRRTIRRDA